MPKSEAGSTPGTKLAHLLKFFGKRRADVEIESGGAIKAETLKGWLYKSSTPSASAAAMLVSLLVGWNSQNSAASRPSLEPRFLTVEWIWGTPSTGQECVRPTGNIAPAGEKSKCAG